MLLQLAHRRLFRYERSPIAGADAWSEFASDLLK